MKRNISIIGLVVALVLSLFSCGYGTNKSYIISASNEQISVQSEIDWGTKSNYKKLMIGPTEVKFLENDYYGKYQYSSDSIRFSSTIDYYKTDSNTSWVTFGVRSDNGKLAYISFKNTDFLSKQRQLDDLDNALEYALKMSKDIVSNIVIDPESYEIIVEESFIMNYMEVFHIVFAKRFSGYISSDQISFEITSKGSLCSVYIGDIGAYDIESTNKIDDESINQSIEKRIEELFKNYLDTYSIQNVSIKKKELIKLPNGNTGVLSTTEVEMKSANNNADEHSYTESIAIVTVVG